MESRCACDLNSNTAPNGAAFRGQSEKIGCNSTLPRNFDRSRRALAARRLRHFAGTPKLRYCCANGLAKETSEWSNASSPKCCQARYVDFASGVELPTRYSRFHRMAASFSVLAALWLLPLAGNGSSRGDHRMAPSGTGRVLRREAKANSAFDCNAHPETGS